MVPILRKILFPIFVLIYLICCPLIIMRALGVVFTPQASKSLTKTGLISLSTFPGDAIVEVNGQLWPERTPTVVNNLEPGNFSIRIALPGYRTWQQTLDVKASHATSLENIILVPETWQLQEITSEPFAYLIPMDGNPFFLLKKGDLFGGLYTYRWPEGFEGVLPPKDEPIPVVPLLSAASPYLNTEVNSIDGIPQSPYILVHSQLDNVKKYVWLDLREEKTKVNDLSDLFNADVEAMWDPQKSTDLFTQNGTELTRLSVDERAIFPKVCRDLTGYGLANKKIYGLSNTAISVFDYEGAVTQTLPHPSSLTNLLQDGTTYKIFPFSDNIFVLWGDHGQLLINKPPYLIAEKSVLGVRLNPKTKQIFFWDHNRIGVIGIVQPDEKELTSGIAVSWPVGKAKRIEQLYLVNEGSHILYRDGNTLFLVDLDPELGAPAEELFKVKRNSEIRYSEKTGDIYFMDEKSGSVYSAALHSTTRAKPAKKEEHP